MALASCIPVSESRLCKWEQWCVQDGGADAFSGLILIKGVGNIVLLVLTGNRMTGVSLKVANLIRKYSYAGRMIIIGNGVRCSGTRTQSP